MFMRSFQIKLLDRRALPKRATNLSAGYDVVACIDKPITIKRTDKATLIPLGFACYMADGHVAGLILPRSGLGHKQGLTLGNTVGVVDGDYQNQWFASAWNRGQQEEIVINPGDRIAQIVFVPVIHPEFDQVEEFTEASVRGFGGFGSTGMTEQERRDIAAKSAQTLLTKDLLPPMGSLGEVIEQ